jgi:hypothetical protein
LYLEDDQSITWESLVSWAWDTALLEPYGLHPAFVRTEYSDDGVVMMLDWTSKITVDGHPQLSTLATPPHRHYIHVPQSFQGFWIASYDLMSRFVTNPIWKEEFAVKQQISGGGYPERSTWMVQLLDIPEGFSTNMVVPFDHATGELFETSRVRHLRNGYSRNVKSAHGKVPWDGSVMVAHNSTGLCKSVVFCT